jgi:glycyl-tRNA synthetase beta chain
MPDFLLEIGLEEVPARMIASAQAELLKRTLALLTREQLISAEPAAHSYSTPRRLAVLIHNVLTQQPDITEDITGPSIKIAFKDGLPTPAAEAFARKSGIAVSDLKTISTPKGDYLAATTLKRGRTASEVLAAELPKEIAAIYWLKSMYWREHKPERFVRPILWLVCLLGEEIVPLTFAGRTAGRATYGHRVLSSGEPFEIQTPESYVAQLEGEYVLADVELRRQKIRKALDKVTREIPNARWREDEALVDSVTHLTEWPDVLLGNFEPAYLTLPEEVLVTVMRDHQKYFAVEDEHGKLAPHFLTVTNIALTEENTPIIRQGNERVLRARFNDARFFWEFDQRTPLAARVALLENVTFQKDLGSYAAKTERVRTIAGYLAGVVESHGAVIDSEALGQAVTLAKTDLTTELVKEFTELQGVIGGLYAEYQGLPTKVSDAIKDQYIPSSMEDGVPRSNEGALIGIADRADTIAGMFRLGMEPTGSKDPFALRRAGNGIIKILAETELPLTLAAIINYSVDGSELNDGRNDAIKEKMRAFLYERLEFYLREARGQAYDVVAAVMAPMRNIPNYGDIRDLLARSEAVTAVRGSEDFLAVSAAFKRMKNILAQAIEQGEDFTHVSGAAFVPTALEVLTKHAIRVRAEVNELGREGKYVPALQKIATLRPDVDRVFSEVMILDKDPLVRQFNLASLDEIVAAISSIADFSEIVTLPTGISFAQTL